MLFDEEWNGARLSVMRSLLGEVPPELREVTISFNKNKRKLTGLFFFDGEISEENIDSMEVCETEASCDFPEDYVTEFRAIRLDYPKKLVIEEPGQWASIYARRERTMSEEE